MQQKISSQKKKTIMNYVYATVVGIFIVACAVTIALVSGTNVKPESNVGEDNVPVVAITYVVPIENATVAKDYSATELQYNDTLKQWEMHRAIDFIAGENLNVFAVTDGTVSNIYSNYLEGTVVEIAHKNGLVSTYKSLSENVSVAVGDKVVTGQTIGTVAETMSQEVNTGAHLHFEMTLNGVKVDPNEYIDLGTK